MIHELKNEKSRWINIDAIDEEAIEFLHANFKFHPLDIEDVKSEIHHPKIDVYRDYVFLVFHIPEFDVEHRRLNSDELNIFIGKDYVVSVAHKSIETLNSFFDRLLHNSRLRRDVLEKGSGFLSYRILSNVFHNIYPTAGKLGKDVVAVEEAVFKASGSESVRFLAITRRNILSMRRILDPERQIIASLSQIRKQFLPETLAPYFDDVRDNIEKAHVLLDTYKDTIDGLNKTNESLISFRTNQIIKMLTVLSVSLMPANLFTGFYGMNIAGLPFAQNPFFVYGVGLLLVGGSLLVLWLLHKRKWY